MFWISFAIFVSTTVVYVLWASGEVQPWNYPPACSIESCREKSDETSEKKPEKPENVDTLQSNIKLKG